MPELEDDLRHQKTVALERKEQFTQLTSQPGWATLIAWAEEQEKLRTAQVMGKMSFSMEAQLENEFTKGEVAGFKLLITYVQQELENSDAIIKAFNRAEEEDDG